MTAIAPLAPTRIEPYSSNELLLAWSTGEEFALPYLEIRYACPCAGCVDENTGQRTLKKEKLDPAVRPKAVQIVGRYAVQITWSDRHDTGMYHFDRLFHLCKEFGRKTH